MRKLSTMLGIEIPIVQAPMGGAVPVRLAAAVSNAGALGTLPLWRADLDTLRGTVRKMRSLTSKPFAVNLVTEFPQQDRLAVCLEEGVPIISFFWRDPGELVKRAKAGGAVVMYTVGNADDARRAVDSGVDVIVAQGWEAGGHVRGTVATLPLVPAIVDAVGDTPVVAAGGIADGRGMAAALALGAAGVWVGTRFLASEEVSIHPEYQRRILAASENDTAWCENLFERGWPDAPHRVLRNSTVRNWEAAGRPPPGQRQGEGEIVARSPTRGEADRYTSFTPGPDTVGDVEPLSMWAGQGVALVRKVQPAAEIVREMNEEAKVILRRLAQQSVPERMG
jgi:NAD(P)H-dependent flavin oxidoreductase YrpB (nitropropane dioxygenase family)